MEGTQVLGMRRAQKWQVVNHSKGHQQSSIYDQISNCKTGNLCIISLRGEVWAHKTSFSPAIFKKN
jgi:hypothetical protein